MDTEMESPQHLTEEPAAEVAPVETRGRWAWDDFGAPRLDSELDRAILVATDYELIEAAQKIMAEVRRRAERRPAFFEAYGLVSTLPKIEPTKGLFASITPNPGSDSVGK